jgi:hypothetical protein
VLWRLSDAGHGASRIAAIGRHPKPITQTDSCIAARKLYSITSSARTSNEGGTVRPSALAVFMLMMSPLFGRLLYR